jgi:PDZ domain
MRIKVREIRSVHPMLNYTNMPSWIRSEIIRYLIAVLPFATIIIMYFTPDACFGDDNKGEKVQLFDDGTMIRVPVNIFDMTRYFLVDTGFTVSAIDHKYEQLLGQRIAQYHASTPLAHESELSIYNCPRIVLGGKQLKLGKISCLDLSMAKLISGQQCDGILGMDFFSNNVVTIDFDSKMLTFQTNVPGKVADSAFIVPLKQFFAHYIIEASVDKIHKLNLLVDTGDSSSISLNDEDWQKLFSTGQAKVFTTKIAGINNQVAESKIGCIERLTIQNQDYTNLHATLIHNPSSLSHLGLNFFRRHIVTFDFANRKIYLRPGQQLSMEDKEDMSGLHLLRTGDETFVYSVDDNSPAFAVGVRAKDEIVSVNGRSASLLTLYEIRKILQSKDGSEINLQINRENHLSQVNLMLKKTI